MANHRSICTHGRAYFASTFAQTLNIDTITGERQTYIAINIIRLYNKISRSVHRNSITTIIDINIIFCE